MQFKRRADPTLPMLLLLLLDHVWEAIALETISDCFKHRAVSREWKEAVVARIKGKGCKLSVVVFCLGAKYKDNAILINPKSRGPPGPVLR